MREPNSPPIGTTKIFTDEELAQMIDPILQTDDKNQGELIEIENSGLSDRIVIIKQQQEQFKKQHPD